MKRSNFEHTKFKVIRRMAVGQWIPSCLQCEEREKLAFLAAKGFERWVDLHRWQAPGGAHWA